MRKLNRLVPAFVPVLSLLALGCGADDGGTLGEEAGLATAGDTKSDRPAIALTTFDDPNLGALSSGQERHVFTSQSGYLAFFGHKAPPSVSFQTDWVIYYSAGLESTGGYSAAIGSASVSSTGRTLYVTTSLVSPGSDCIVSQELTTPHALATIPKQRNVRSVRFSKNDSTNICDPCAGVRCITGAHCHVDDTGAPVCGSPCDTVRCAAGYSCVVTGNAVGCQPDACPPNNKLCMVGAHYDNTPGVCKCVPDACPPNKYFCIRGSHYDGTPGVCACVPDSHCNSDADCRLEDNYCGGCACDALATHETAVTCTNPVACFRQPCQGLTAACDSATNTCVAR